MVIVAVFAILSLAGLKAGIETKEKILAKICGSVLCAVAFFALWLLMLMEMSAGSEASIQLFGASMPWLVPVICGGLLFLIMLLIWKPFADKTRMIIALLLVAAIAVTAMCYKNIFIELPGGDSEILLEKYAPFAEGTLAASLGEPPALALTENLPRLDGATALYPLYSAFVRATYPEGDNYRLDQDLSDYALTFEEWVGKYNLDRSARGEELLRKKYSFLSPFACNRTWDAFRNLLNGDAEVAFLMDVSDEQRQMAEEKGLALALEPIGREAFVFLANSRNKIDGLTQGEIRAIYSGEISDWSGIGQGGASGRIEAYQRPEGSGSQTALRGIMGDAPIMAPKAELVYSIMDGMYDAIADYRNYRNALGYSFRFYIEGMLNDAELGKVKLLAIDGVSPTPQAIADGTYPFASDFYAVTVADREYESDRGGVGAKARAEARAENARKLIDWILSAQGQELVEKTGYAPLRR